MNLKTRDIPFELKAAGKDGSFEGYASVFGNLDDGYDVVEAGAFKEFAKTRDGKILVLNQHNMREPIGKSEVKEDDKGLLVKGQLVLDDPVAARVYTHMKAGTIDAMSIGFDVLPGGAEYTESGVRRLKALKLWEVSVVTFGMNAQARIDMVKGAGQITTIREFEDFLRDAGGFSKAQALQIASGGWKALQGRRESDDAAVGSELLDFLGSVTQSHSL